MGQRVAQVLGSMSVVYKMYAVAFDILSAVAWLVLAYCKGEILGKG